MNSSGVIKESSSDGLNRLCSFFIQGCRLILGCILNLLAIDGRCRGTRSILWAFWWTMVEFFKSLGDIVRHGNVDISSVVVPIDGERKVTAASPVNCK